MPQQYFQNDDTIQTAAHDPTFNRLVLVRPTLFIYIQNIEDILSLNRNNCIILRIDYQIMHSHHTASSIPLIIIQVFSCAPSRMPTHNAISMVESTDEINMDITLYKVLCINPRLIYMDLCTLIV